MRSSCPRAGGDEESAAPGTTSGETTVSVAADTVNAPSEPTEHLGDFLTRHIEDELKRQYGRAWDALHPGQQASSRVRSTTCADVRTAPWPQG